MNFILREKNYKLKDRIKEVGDDIRIQNNKIETQNKYIKDVKILNEEVKEDKLTQIDNAYHEVIELKQRIKVAQSDYDVEFPKVEKNLNEYNDHKQANMHAMARIKSRIESVVKNAKFYEDHLKCPTCTQSITQEIRENKIQESKDDAKDLQKNIIQDKGVQVIHKSPVKKEELTPGTRSKMRKIKSEEDFVKFQVPWIL